MRPSQPVLHFCPFLNQRVFWSAVRSLLLLERLGTENFWSGKSGPIAGGGPWGVSRALHNPSHGAIRNPLARQPFIVVSSRASQNGISAHPAGGRRNPRRRIYRQRPARTVVRGGYRR